MVSRAELKRRDQRRAAHNAAARLQLPAEISADERKARAERLMAEHDALLERQLVLAA